MIVLAMACLIPAAPQDAAPQGAAPAKDPYYPIAKGARWTFKTDVDDETEIVHEVMGKEKVGEVECLVVEHRSHHPAFDRPRVLRKEWLTSDGEGVRLHQTARGPTTFAVAKPFFKIKHRLLKDDEWEGKTEGDDNPPTYRYVVGGEEEVTVPAGRFRARRVRFKIVSGPHVAEGIEWWVRGTGLVRYELDLTTAGFSMTAELKEFKKGE